MAHVYIVGVQINVINSRNDCGYVYFYIIYINIGYINIAKPMRCPLMRPECHKSYS